MEIKRAGREKEVIKIVNVYNQEARVQERGVVNEENAGWTVQEPANPSGGEMHNKEGSCDNLDETKESRRLENRMADEEMELINETN